MNYLVTDSNKKLKDEYEAIQKFIAAHVFEGTAKLIDAHVFVVLV